MVIFQSYVKLPEGIIPFKLKGHQFSFHPKSVTFPCRRGHMSRTVSWKAHLWRSSEILLQGNPAGESMGFFCQMILSRLFLGIHGDTSILKKKSKFHLNDSYFSQHQMINPNWLLVFFSLLRGFAHFSRSSTLNEHNTLGQAKMLAQTAIVPCVPNGTSGWSSSLGSVGETGHGAIGLCLFAGCPWQKHSKQKAKTKSNTY